jgi:hypothetical protein
MLIPLGILAGSGAGAASDYQLIATANPSGVSSFDFGNLGALSSTYRHLEIRYTARANPPTTTTALDLRFNANTTGYARHEFFGSFTTAGHSVSINQNRANIGLITGANAQANVFAAGVIAILDPYSTTKNKTIRTLIGNPNIESGSRVGLSSGLWANTASVTSITLALQNVDTLFVSGSRFSLYGIKG